MQRGCLFSFFLALIKPGCSSALHCGKGLLLHFVIIINSQALERHFPGFELPVVIGALIPL